MRTIITGCDLLVPSYSTKLTAHGDLWQVGNVWVFNAVLGEDGEARWNIQPRPRFLVTLGRETNYFERRGVFVFPQYAADLSPEATQHIEKWSS